MNDQFLNLFEKYQKKIRYGIKGIFVLFMFVYVAFFVKLGLSIVKTSGGSTTETIIYGLLLAVFMVGLFFIEHFSGGIDFDLKWVGLLLGFALGGASIGLIAGSFQSFIGWGAGFLVGLAIIMLTLRLYTRET